MTQYERFQNDEGVYCLICKRVAALILAQCREARIEALDWAKDGHGLSGRWRWEIEAEIERLRGGGE